MQDLTRACSQLLAAGAFRDVRRYGWPRVFVAKVETGVTHSWMLGVWITPRWQLNLALQLALE